MEAILYALATAAGAGIMKLWNRHKASLPFLDRAIHAAFEAALRFGVDEKMAVHRIFRELFDSAWEASGHTLTQATRRRADTLFDAMWAAAERTADAHARAALAKAGRQGEAFIAELEKKIQKAKLGEVGPDGRVHREYGGT